MADDFTKAERIIIRNQRLMMLALANLVRENTSSGNVYHAEKLRERIKLMEASLEWIAAPGERIG